MLNFWNCFWGEVAGWLVGRCWAISGTHIDSVPIAHRNTSTREKCQQISEGFPGAGKSWSFVALMLFWRLQNSISFSFMTGFNIKQDLSRDMCFNWQQYQNIKSSSLIKQAVSYIWHNMQKNCSVAVLIRKERKNWTNWRIGISYRGVATLTPVPI